MNVAQLRSALASLEGDMEIEIAINFGEGADEQRYEMHSPETIEGVLVIPVGDELDQSEEGEE